MITGKDIYEVLAALVPLYVAMILAYGSVRWWNIFTPDQCSGINRFVAVFAVPLLSFHFISSNNPYAMNYRFIAADSLQKVVILVALFVWQAVSKRSSLEWMITLFSLSTLPNTLVMGIPLLKAMYGDFSGPLMVQIVVLQSVIWYTLMLFMFEYRGAKLLISEQFPETGGSITSFQVDPDVISLNGREALQADAEIGDDGRLHVVVRKSSVSSSIISSFNKTHLTSMTPRASNLTGVEIYSVQSSREPTPRASSFNQNDFYAMFNASKAASPKHGYTNSNGGQGGVGGADVFSCATPRSSNFDEELIMKMGGRNSRKGGRSMSGEMFSAPTAGGANSYPPPNPTFFSGSASSKKKGSGGIVWSSNASPAASDTNIMHDSSKPTPSHDHIPTSKVMQDLIANMSPPRKMGGDSKEVIDIEEVASRASPYSTRTTTTSQKKLDNVGDQNSSSRKHQMPPASVMTRLILIMVWRKLIRNPNTYSSLLGVIWSLVSFRWGIEMPSIVKGSISILSDTGLGMAMFSLGLFMALQPKIIACGKRVATFSMAVRFLTGPAVIAATSIAVGLRGVLLHVAIVQAALPQGIVPFVFAKEYNVHPYVLSTAVIFGMVIALPVTILYYLLLGF